MLLSFGILLNLLVVVICEKDVLSGWTGFLLSTWMMLIIRTVGDKKKVYLNASKYVINCCCEIFKSVILAEQIVN